MQDNNILDEIIKSIKPHIDFVSFFTLSDSEKEIDFFWNDLKGNSVDCNIYHPKYKLKFTPGSFTNPITCIENGIEKITSRYLECVCIDKNRLYNKDGIELLKKSVTLIQTKTAKTDRDFELIYQRELEETQSLDTPEFKSWLIAKVMEMKENEQSLPANERKRSLNEQALAGKFLTWISNRGFSNNYSDISELAKVETPMIGESTFAYRTIALIEIYPLLEKEANANGIQNMMAAQRLCKKYNKNVATAAKMLWEKYKKLLKDSERLCTREKDDAENFINDLSIACENIDAKNFPKGKERASKELKDYARKTNLEELLK